MLARPYRYKFVIIAIYRILSMLGEWEKISHNVNDQMGLAKPINN